MCLLDLKRSFYARQYSNNKYFPTIDMVSLVETWKKDGVGIAKIHGYTYFSTAQYGSSNIQSGTTI